MKKRNITYIFICLLVCGLFTACSDSAKEKVGTEVETVNIEDKQDDANVTEDSVNPEEASADEEDAIVEENSDSEEDVADVEDDFDDEDDTEGYYGDKYSVYNNPIDEYYRPIIYSWDASQVEIRAAQDAYRKVWKQEFKHLMNWLKKKCVYEEDKENIIALEKNVEKQAEVQKEVCKVEMLDGYEVPFPGSGDGGVTRMSLPGNGTRSALNQMEGEIYRDASMKIIMKGSGYKFRKIDYSKVTVE